MAFTIQLTRLLPSQLYICREKLDVVIRAASEGEPSDPVPVKERRFCNTPVCFLCIKFLEHINVPDYLAVFCIHAKCHALSAYKI